MKRPLSILGRMLCASMLVSAFLLNTSCMDIKTDVEDLKNRLDALDSTTIATINEQISAIGASISDLKDVDVAINNVIDTLERKFRDEHDAAVSEMEAKMYVMQATLLKLKEKEDSLVQKISDLQIYVDEGLTKNKDWANATFATLEQYSSVQEELSAIRILIDKVKDDISVECDEAIRSSISSSEAGMKSWVNDILADGYYDIATIDSKLSVMSQSLGETDAELHALIEDQRKALEKAQYALSLEYKDYIAAAVAAGGIIDDAIAEKIGIAQDNLQLQIDNIINKLQDIEIRTGKLEENFANLIQSVRYIPKYKGKIALMSKELKTVTLDFLVSPSRLASSIASAWQSENGMLTGYLRYTDELPTKAVDAAVRLNVISVEGTSEGMLSVRLKECSSAPIDDAFFRNERGAIAYVVISDGINDVASEIVEIQARGIVFSADNSTWSETIPASFSTLYVKTSDGSLTATHMDEIKAAVDAQSGPVTLDMSAAKYVSKAFPETFTATADAPDTKLTAIKFPYNVEEISANAFKYYTALESIDLSQIKVIGGVAFQYSGLKTVTIPANVTKIGSMAFSYLKNLTEVYYNPTIDWSQYTVQDITNNNRHLSNRSTDWSNADWNNSDNPTKITFGPNVTLVTGYFFDSNAKVTELIVEGDNLQFVYQWAIRARNIKRIEFKGVLPTWSNHHSPGMGGDFATELGEKEGVIVVPDKYLAEAFENDVVKSLLNTGKYRLRQASNEFDVNDPVLPSAKLEYSADGLSYTSTIPATFSTLYVKALTSGFMDAEQLTPIKTAIDAQSEPVSLDLSGVKYEATSFPAIFAGTADAPYTKLKSIKFPSNVNEVEAKAFAYCSVLESADLAQITSYGDECFRNTGLKSLRLDNNVKRLGSKAFYNCFNLAEVYYNPTDSRLDNWGETNRVNYYSFAFEEGYRENHTTDLVFTVGPDTRLGRYMLDGNANLTEVIFYNGNRQHQQSIRNVHYLSSVVIKNAEGLIHYKGGSGFKPLGDMVDASVTKTVTVPKGCLAKYTEDTYKADGTKNDNCEFYEAFTDQGFTFVEATE